MELTCVDTVAWLSQPHFSPHTRHAYWRHLRRFLDWCAATGRDPEDALAGVSRPRTPKWRPKPVTDGQLAALLAACRSDRHIGMILLGAYGGLRREEIAAFRGEDLDPWSRTLHVRRGKGGKPAEIGAAEILVRHARRMPGEGWWFPSPVDQSRPIAPESVTAAVVALGERAGVGHVTPHRLRHWCGTTLAREGVPLNTIRDFLRHDNVNTTQWYVLVTAPELVAAAARLPGAA